MILNQHTRLARTAGILYLLIIVFGLIAQIFVRDNLVDYENAAITASRILNSESWYRFGFVSELIMLMCDVGVTVVLYIILKDTNKNLSILATAFRLCSIIILAVTALTHYSALSFLDGSAYLKVFNSDQLNAFALFAVKIHGVGYNISLLFFGVHLVLLGLLIKQSTIFPHFLGLLLIIGGCCYIINSITWFQFPSWVKYIYPYILIPSAIGEWLFCFYLIVKGIKVVKEQVTYR
jgi:hypothetical protein